MKKSVLDTAVNIAKSTTKEALQELFDNINQGQQKQLVKKPNIKALLDRFGVEY